MNHKRTTVVTLLVLAASALSPVAQAEPPRGHWRDGGHDRFDHRYRAPPSHGYPGHRVYRDHTGAVIVGAAALGSLLWLSTYDRPVSPPPQQVVVVPSAPQVVVAPPAPRTPPPPSDVWYYCRSAGAYYPYAQTCTSPWELVPAQ